MIAELVTTVIEARDFEPYLESGAAKGFAIAQRHLPLIAAFRPFSGVVNQIVELAIYEDYDQRDAAIAALRLDPEWRAHRRLHGGAIRHEESTILNPAAISPITDMAGFTAAVAEASSRPAPMLFELRTYTARPGQMPQVMKMLKEEGNPLTHQFVEWPVAYFTAETGLSNRVMMFWAYSSAGERARRKSRMLPDPRFQELGSRFNPNFSEQRSDLFAPLPHSPLR